MGSVSEKPTDGAAAAGRVLGVDPGTVVTGWGVVNGDGQSARHIASGVIRARGSRAERLASIHREMCDVCAKYSPVAVSLEKTFVGDNVQSAFRLGEARGAVMVAAAGVGLPVIEYSPAEIKLAVAGSGRAAKAQMQAMVGRLLGLDSPLAEDEADALGAALCHVHTGRFHSAIARQVSSFGGLPQSRRRRTSPRR